MKVTFFPYQPHCFAFGGFEVQMLSAFDALSALQVNVDKIDVWNKAADFDIAHIWGLDLGNYENIKWAKKSGKKVIVTALINYFDTVRDRVKFQISSYIYKQRLVKELLPYIDAFVVVNDLQADAFERMYKIDRNKIHIIPNIVSDIYFDLRTQGSYKQGDYVLAVGNVCKRKNQVKLAQACINKNKKLVVIGKPLAGEEEYADMLDKLVAGSANIKWIKGLKENSAELVKYFSECFVFALPGLFEQQPIALLEAAVLNKPLLTANYAYGKQSYYKNSCLVDPTSVESIENAIEKIFLQPKDHIPPYELLINCRATNVAQAYLNVYNKIV